MKKIILALLLTSCVFGFSQVGIGTTNPLNTLDVNGDVRIRSVSTLANTPSYVLVPDENGVVSKYTYPASGTSTATPTSSVLKESSLLDTDIVINKKTYTTVPGSSIEITVPNGGRAVTVHFSSQMNIIYQYVENGPKNDLSGVRYFLCKLFVDGKETNVYQAGTINSSSSFEGSFVFSSLLNLSEGTHQISAAMIAVENSENPNGFEETNTAKMGSVYIQTSFVN